jgi:hypothetical protein
MLFVSNGSKTTPTLYTIEIDSDGFYLQKVYLKNFIASLSIIPARFAFNEIKY